MARKTTGRRTVRRPEPNAPVGPALAFGAGAAAHRETVEYAKGGLNMMVWWFNPDSGEHYINPSPANPEELENARSRLRTLAQWLRDIAAQVEVRLDADKPGSVASHGGRR